MKFKIIEHPSDIGIEASGKDLKEVFANAALGMFSLMAEMEEIKPHKSFEVKIKGNDKEELLVNWLNELIFIEDSKKVLLKEFKINKLTDKELEARVFGEEIKQNLHELHRPIKAATFNLLEISEKKARVIFDV